jgi:hypothetical protein
MEPLVNVTVRKPTTTFVYNDHEVIPLQGIQYPSRPSQGGMDLVKEKETTVRLSSHS